MGPGFMLYCTMPRNPRKPITDEQWIEAAEAYELGFKRAYEIASELGISPSTVSREFKRRGCRKGCRAAETVIALQAELDARALARAAAEEARENAAWERSAAMDRMIEEMMSALLAADRAGDLSAAAPIIQQVGGAVGVKPLR